MILWMIMESQSRSFEQLYIPLSICIICISCTTADCRRWYRRVSLLDNLVQIIPSDIPPRWTNEY